MVKLSNFMKLFKPYLFEELYRKAKLYREKGIDVINLSVGDPEMGADKRITNYLVNEIKNIETHRYPNTKGNETLRKAIVKWHKKRHDVEFDYNNNITILIGTKEGIAHLPLVLMNKNDVCLIPDPTYPTYRTGVWMVGGEIYNVPLLEKNNFLPDLGKIPLNILKRAKLFFLNYPNNPTGACMDFNYMKELVKWAKRNEIFLALDLAYSEIYFDSPTHSIFEIDGAIDIAVEFYSFSKNYSVPGWRVGWVCGNEKVVCALNTVKENIDSGQFNAIQNACAYALNESERIVPKVREIYKNRAMMFYNALTKNGWKMIKPQGSCFIWTHPPVHKKSIDVCNFILKHSGILLAPGSGFGKYGEGFIRIATTEKNERIKEAIKRISTINWSNL